MSTEAKERPARGVDESTGEIIVYCWPEICCSLCEWDAVGWTPRSYGSVDRVFGVLVRTLYLPKDTPEELIARSVEFHRHAEPLKHEHREWRKARRLELEGKVAAAKAELDAFDKGQAR